MSNFFDQFDNYEPEQGAIKADDGNRYLSDRFDINAKQSRAYTSTGYIRGVTTEYDKFQRQKDLDAYDALPQWRTPVEGLVSLAGQIYGGLAAPENILPVGLGARAVESVGAKLPAVGARFFAGAIDAGVQNAAVDAGGQALEYAHGQRQDFSLEQLATGTVIGGLTGGLLSAGLGRGRPVVGGEVPEFEPGGFDAALSPEALPVPPSYELSPISEVGRVPEYKLDGVRYQIRPDTAGEALDAQARNIRGLGERPPETTVEAELGGEQAPIGDLFNSPIEDVSSSASPAETGRGQPQLQIVRPAQLQVDAGRFQFKDGGDGAGVTERLQGVKDWRPERAGVILVFEDKNGQQFVADGHQRVGLARRIEAAGAAEIQMPAYVFKEADGFTDVELRHIAANKNIAEGTGTAIDAAKLFRSGGVDPETADLPPASALVRDATGLAKLSNDAFSMAVNEVVDPKLAAVVGRLVDDPALHVEVISALKSLNVRSIAEAQSVVQDLLAEPTFTEKQDSLFGTEEMTRLLLKEKAKIRQVALSALKKDKQIFKRLVEEEKHIAEVGNVLDNQANRERAAHDDIILTAIDKLSRRAGPIADALNDAAKRLASGESAAGSARVFIAAVRDGINQGHGISEIFNPARAKDKPSSGGTPEKDDLLGAPPERKPPSSHDVPIARELASQPAVNIEPPDNFKGLMAMPPKQAMASLRDFAKTELAGKSIVNASDGQAILIPWQGLKHAMQSTKTPVSAVATLKLPELLEKAVYAGAVADKLERRNMTAVHYYDVNVVVGNHSGIIRAVVREAPDGRRYYDHFEIMDAGRGLAPGEGINPVDPGLSGKASPSPEVNENNISAKESGDKGGGDGLAIVASPERPGKLAREPLGTLGWLETGAETRVKDIADKLVAALDVPAHRLGHITVMARGAKGAGQYSPKTGAVRLAKADDFDVLAHEIGHHVEQKIGAPVQALMSQHAAELKPMAYDGLPPEKLLTEGFAEYMRTFVTNPAYAAARAPGFDQAFRGYMSKNHGEIYAALNEAATAWRAWLEQPSTAAVSSTIVSGKEPSWTAGVKKDLSRMGWAGTIADKLGRAYTAFFDDLNPLNQAVSRLAEIYKENTGEALQLNVASDPYKLARMSRGAWNAGHMDISYGVHPYRGNKPGSASLRDALVTALGKPNGLSKWDEGLVKQFGAYLWSRRALGEWQRFDQGIIPNRPDKLARGDHVMNIQELEKAFPNFKPAAEMVYEWSNALWAKKRDAGLITLEQWQDGMKIKDYVPGYRAFDQAGDGTVSGQRGSVKGGMVKRFKGSSRDVMNPVESLIADAYETSMAIARNDVVKQLDRLALLAGNGGSAIAERIPAHQLKATMIDPIEALDKAMKQANVEGRDAKNLRDAMEAAIGDEKLALFRPAVINEKGEPIAFFRDGGELKALRLADGEFGNQIYQALTLMHRGEAGLFTELLSKPAAMLRLGVTAAPQFVLANFIRDQATAMIFYGKPFVRAKTTFKGMGDEMFSRDAARAYNAASGIMGGANVAALGDVRVRHDLQALRKKGWAVETFSSFRGILQATEISETGMRLSLFKTFYDEAKLRGLDEFEAQVEAAYKARDHLDFDRRGTAMTAVARLVPFFNASLQGLDKFNRHMLTPLFGEAVSGADKQARAEAVKAWARLSMVTVAGMGLYALNSQHDEFRDLSPQTKATHWMIKMGNKWLAVPKPFELAAFINIGEAGYDAMVMRDPRWASQYLEGLSQVLMPPNVMEGNPTITMAYSLATGVDVRTGQPLVPPGMEGMAPWLQYSARTSELAKSIGKAINVSPAIIDHTIVSHTGSLGRDALSLYDYALSDKPLPGWDDMAVTRRFIKDGSRGSSSTTAFWELISSRSGILEGSRKTYQALIDSGDEVGAADYLAAQDGISKTWIAAGSIEMAARRIHPFQRAQTAVTAINALRREMAESEIKTAQGLVAVNRLERGAADDILEELGMVMARNALVELKVPGWEGRVLLEEASYLRELQAASPEIAAALADRFATANVLRQETVIELWPELDERLRLDGSAAQISDLAAKAKAAGTEMGGEKIKRRKRAAVPGG